MARWNDSQGAIYISLDRKPLLRYREHKMRRILSCFLLLFLTLPLVAPAVGQTAQQRLLLCCRKGGAHHCLTSATTEDGFPAPTLRGHCPAVPNPAVSGHASGWIAASDRLSSVASDVTPLRVRQVEAGYRISFLRSRQKRGPPAFVLS